MSQFAMLDHTVIHSFQSKILDWYEINKRQGLPWRDSFDPYQIFVSEVMSQQTQIERVVPKFLAFIDTAPNFQSLADLDKTTLLTLRSGLGFNSRALRLQEAARVICTTHNGSLPQDRAQLQDLPGIGAYCSASLLAFVFNETAPVIDTNIRRVFIHELSIDPKTTRKNLEAIAVTVTPDGRANDRNNALMDYGALEATAKKTGIKPLSKQSKFKGSKREVRGNILKWLVEHGSASYTNLKEKYSHDAFESIVETMVTDGLITQSGDMLTIG